MEANVFPSISSLFLRLKGPKFIAKLDGDHGRICSPLVPRVLHGILSVIAYSVNLQFGIKSHSVETQQPQSFSTSG